MLECKSGSQDLSGLETELKTSMTVEMPCKSGWVLGLLCNNITLNKREDPTCVKAKA